MQALTNNPLPLAGVTGLLEEMTASQFNGEIKLDRDSGNPVWVVGLSARIEGLTRRVPLDAQVVAPHAPSIPIGSEVRLVDPTVTFWVLKSGKAGVTVRARAVEPLNPPTATTPTQPVEGEAPRAGLPTKPQPQGQERGK